MARTDARKAGELSFTEAEKRRGLPSTTLSRANSLAHLPIRKLKVEKVVTYLIDSGELDKIITIFGKDNQFTAGMISARKIFDRLFEYKAKAESMEQELDAMKDALAMDIVETSQTKITTMADVTSGDADHESTGASECELTDTDNSNPDKTDPEGLVMENLDTANTGGSMPTEMTRPKANNLQYEWNTINPSTSDVQASLPSKSLATLNFEEACYLIGKSQYEVRGYLGSRKLRRYKFGFHPGELVQLGRNLGGVLLTMTYKIEWVDEYDDYGNPDSVRKRVPIRIEVDGNWIWGKSVPLDTVFESESRIYYGLDAINAVHEFTFLPFERVVDFIDSLSVKAT